MLHTHWSAEALQQVRVEFKKALALKSQIRRAGLIRLARGSTVSEEGRPATQPTPSVCDHSASGARQRAARDNRGEQAIEPCIAATQNEFHFANSASRVGKLPFVHRRGSGRGGRQLTVR